MCKGGKIGTGDKWNPDTTPKAPTWNANVESAGKHANAQSLCVSLDPGFYLSLTLCNRGKARNSWDVIDWRDFWLAENIRCFFKQKHSRMSDKILSFVKKAISVGNSLTQTNFLKTYFPLKKKNKMGREQVAPCCAKNRLSAISNLEVVVQHFNKKRCWHDIR